MTTAINILGVIDILLCIAIILLVLFQSDDSDGLGSLAGQRMETFFGQNRESQGEVVLKRVTTGLCIAFAVITVVLNLLIGRL